MQLLTKNQVETFSSRCQDQLDSKSSTLEIGLVLGITQIWNTNMKILLKVLAVQI